MMQAATVLASLVAFVQEAGALALETQAAGFTTHHKGAGFGQAVTEADLRISALMHARFDPRLVEEETAGDRTKPMVRDLLGAADDWSYIGDRIDGTAPFSGGLTGWGTMIAACASDWPRAGAMILPGWVDERDGAPRAPAPRRGLLLAAADGAAYWAPTLHGRMTQALRPLEPIATHTRHVGWLCVAARGYNLDYTQGFFPICESGCIADAAALATGRLDASTFMSKLWDLAPALPILETLGFSLYRWPDLHAAPRDIADMFDDAFACEDLWLICRSRTQAEALGRAIRRSRA